MLCASFVDLRDGLTACQPLTRIKWPRSCVDWNWNRIHKWLDKRKLKKLHSDGCRFRLTDLNGTLVKKPWTFATDCQELRQEFDGKRCRKDHDHAKCLKDSDSYNRATARTLHESFKKHHSRSVGLFPCSPSSNCHSNPRSPRSPISAGQWLPHLLRCSCSPKGRAVLLPSRLLFPAAAPAESTSESLGRSRYELSTLFERPEGLNYRWEKTCNIPPVDHGSVNMNHRRLRP